MVYITNAFSLNMLEQTPATIEVKKMDKYAVMEALAESFETIGLEGKTLVGLLSLFLPSNIIDIKLSLNKNSTSKIEIKKIDKEAVLQILANGFTSAVGHESTAQFISELLSIHIPLNRIDIKLKKGDKAIVFQIKKRLEEGKILSKEELSQIPHEIFLVEVL